MASDNRQNRELDISGAHLERILYTRAITASINAGLKCVCEGDPRVLTGTSHSKFWFRACDPTMILHAGRPWERSLGLIQFTLFGPDEMIESARQIVEAYQRKKWKDPVGPGLVTTHRMAFRPLRSNITVVDGSYEYLWPL